jgi:hypothetical protein
MKWIWIRAQLGTIVVVVLSSPLACAQEDERYDFDGVADMDPQPADPTDWMTSVNWSDGGFDPDPAFGPPIPDFGTRVEIQTSTFGVDAPAIGPGDTAEAFEVRIGRFGGAGLLTMTGGTLTTADSCGAFPFTCNRRLRVGSADVAVPENRHPGTFNLMDGIVTTDTLWIGSGSRGEMNMSGGVVNTRGDLSMDWSLDAASHFSMTGGTVNVGTNLRMYRSSVLDLDGGSILIAGAAGLGWTDTNVTQTPDVTVTVSSGLMEASGVLRVGGAVVLNGGVLRTDSFEESLSAGTVEINGDGKLQFNHAQESIADVENLIDEGFLTTSSPLGTEGLMIEVVDVNGTDFTQVALSSVSAGVPGDYNGNDVVDAADYTRFRDNLGMNVTLMNENPAAETRGLVDQEDYDFWAASFGDALGSVRSKGSVTGTAVPELSSLVYGCVFLTGGLVLGRRAQTAKGRCSSEVFHRTKFGGGVFS